MARRRAATVSLGCILAICQAANGQSADDQHGVREHDGFHLRLAVGPAYLHSAWESETAVQGAFAGQRLEATISGAGVDGLVLLGGTPAAGLAIGGGIALTFVPSPQIDRAGTTGDAKHSAAALIGAFADGFFSEGGWHAGGMLGVGGYDFCCIPTREEGIESSLLGFGAAGWVGYDAWVSDQWSLGGLVRMTGLHTGQALGNSEGQTAETYALSVLVSSLHH